VDLAVKDRTKTRLPHLPHLAKFEAHGGYWMVFPEGRGSARYALASTFSRACRLAEEMVLGSEWMVGKILFVVDEPVAA
jgi:hypothetical protein